MNAVFILLIAAGLSFRASQKEPESSRNIRVADRFPGSTAGEKIAAAIADLRGPGIVDATSLKDDLSIRKTLRIDQAVTLRLPAQMLTCSMQDTGTVTGCINIISDNVTIEGIKGASVITQRAGANIQTAIYLGHSRAFTVRNVMFDWNEAHQKKKTEYYTVLRSSAGASDIRVEDNEFTACGDRCIDIRGGRHTWIINNYFHQTGINVGGTGGTGNGVSVDVDGKSSSSDTWIIGNRVEEWSDTALACPHGSSCHMVGNVVRGRLDFGNVPSKIESGIDLVGCSDCEAVNNRVINVALFSLNAESQSVGGITYTSTNVHIAGNEFKHTLGSNCDSLVNISASLAPAQLRNITLAGNSFEGVRLAISDTDRIAVVQNTFKDVCTKNYGAAIVMSQSGGELKNFAIAGNSFTTTNSSVRTALLITSKVTANPGRSFVGPNEIQAGITPVSNSSGISFEVRE